MTKARDNIIPVLLYGDVGKGTFEEPPTTFADLQNRLESLRAEYTPLLGMPYGVDIVREGRGRLSIGLGDDLWILTFFPDDDSPPRYSLGDQEVRGDELFYFGDQSRMSRKYLIPRAEAEKVIRSWFEDGVVSDAIRWTAKIY